MGVLVAQKSGRGSVPEFDRRCLGHEDLSHLHHSPKIYGKHFISVTKDLFLKRPNKLPKQVMD